jgi:diadenosine tetraphosphate (Ap4A) HIT family hydrolase
MNEEDWLYLQKVVQKVAKAVAVSTGAIRMYLASLGSPERNAHIHIHVCPCPPGTPMEKQQFAAMDLGEGKSLDVSLERMKELATSIKQKMNIK